MKKQTQWLLFIGAVFMAVPFFIKSAFALSSTIADFIKGLGVGIIIAAFFLELWRSNKTKQSNSH
jgi:hypothetical protein